VFLRAKLLPIRAGLSLLWYWSWNLEDAFSEAHPWLPIAALGPQCRTQLAVRCAELAASDERYRGRERRN
jgi:hypothetical protein